MTNPIRLLFTLLTLAIATPAWADVSLSPLFSDNAILQREIPIPVWGWDKPGQQVTVTLDADTKTATADATGHWSVKLDARKPGPPCKLTVKGSSTAEFSNILIGEVWFCSGQSNMSWQMSATSDLKNELTVADRPNLRSITIPNVKTLTISPRQGALTYPLPASHKPGTFAWRPCSPQTLPAFSGVAYYFGRDLNQELDVPVGLITSAWGGTIIEAWISKPTLLAQPFTQPMVKRHEESVDSYPQRLEVYKQQVQKLKQIAKERAATQPATTQPVAIKLPPAPADPTGPNVPAALYNGMVAPVAPYAIRGAIWYQGESNAGRYNQYAALLADLVSDWRKAWGQGDFPFLVIQLPNYKASGWPEFREAQVAGVKKIPNADYAVTIDVGSNANIHPGNKKDPAGRLALVALKNVYGKSNLIDRGPTFAGLKISGSNAIVTFENTGSGLTTKDGKPPAHFEIAGADHVYVPATGTIDGNTIILTSPAVPAPISVRFAWSSAITGFNLYNKENLPAAPFRTNTAAPAKPPATAPAK